MQKYAAPAAVAFALVMVAVLALRPNQGGTSGGTAGHSSEEPGGDQVDVTLHVMSKCPYGVKAVDAFTPIARKLGGRLKLNLEYIGREEDGELTSMHGPDEVAGNKIQLCVHAHASYDNWMDFLDCQNQSWREIPQGWERCAREHGVPVDDVRSCVEGDEGTRLLRASYQKSQEAGARGSPTIIIGGEKHMGGRTEQALARAICSRYEGTAPRYCREIPPPPEIPITILVDRRCDNEECNTEAVERRYKAQIPGAKISTVDYSTSEGRELFQKASLKMLPAVLIGREIQQDQDAFRAIRGAQRQGDMFVETLGRFDPERGEWVPRPEVPIQILVDGRCKTRECSAAPRFQAFIERQVPNAKIATLDYGSDDGRALWTRVKTALDNADEPAGRAMPLGLPLALFGASITEETDVYSRLQRRFRKVGEEYMFQLGPWDPTAEICDNETDDDSDGQIDCRDSQCSEQMVCRPEKAREIRAFIMSGCPYGIQVLNAMPEVLENFGRARSKINFRIEFIGDVAEDGTISSMHGQYEVDEDIRQACAQAHYGDNYAFMDYVICRNKSIRSPDWEQCVTGPMKADVIRSCAEGEEGPRLVRESMGLAKSLGIGGSPSWLLNNRYEMDGRDPESIKAAFCERNELPECGRSLSKTPAKRGAGSCG